MKPDWKSITIALAVGIVLGVFGVLRFGPMGPHGFWNSPEKMHHRMMQQFTRKLQLTPDQQTKVSLILDQTRDKIDSLRRETKPKFEAVRDEANSEIRAVLTPEQQVKFDVLSAEMKARFEKRRHMMWDRREGSA